MWSLPRLRVLLLPLLLWSSTAQAQLNDTALALQWGYTYPTAAAALSAQPLRTVASSAGLASALRDRRVARVLLLSDVVMELADFLPVVPASGSEPAAPGEVTAPGASQKAARVYLERNVTIMSGIPGQLVGLNFSGIVGAWVVGGGAQLTLFNLAFSGFASQGAETPADRLGYAAPSTATYPAFVMQPGATVLHLNSTYVLTVPAPNCTQISVYEPTLRAAFGANVSIPNPSTIIVAGSYATFTVDIFQAACLTCPTAGSAQQPFTNLTLLATCQPTQPQHWYDAPNATSLLRAVNSTQPAAGSDGGGGDSNTGAIVGGVVGGAALVLVVLAALAFWRREQRRDPASKARAMQLASSGVSVSSNPAGGARTPPPAPPFGAASLARESAAKGALDRSNPLALAALGSSAESSRALASHPGTATGSARSTQSADSQLRSGGSNQLRSGGSGRLRSGGSGQLRSGGSGALISGGSGEVGMARRGSGEWAARMGLDPAADDWQILPDEVEICKNADGSDCVLGTGAYGKVYKGLRLGVHLVAVKVLLNELTDARHNAMFEKEVSIMRQLHHRNIVQLLGACNVEGRTAIIMEYAENGNLFHAIALEDPAKSKYRWFRGTRGDKKLLGLARRIAADIACGLHFLHSRRVVHMDMKSPNVLLDRDFTAKITDVGLAKVRSAQYVSTVLEAGTLAWVAPEILLGKRVTERADIYSYGVVLWELITGEPPQRGNLRPVRVPEECPPEAALLLEQCLRVEPEERPAASEILARLQALAPAKPDSQQQP